MNFELTEEQRGLRESTRGLLAAEAPTSAIRRLADDGIGFDISLWAKGAALRWPALALPEVNGGLDQGLVDLAWVSIEHGRHVLPGPQIPAAVVAEAISRAPSETTAHADVFPALMDGCGIAAWGFAELGQP